MIWNEIILDRISKIKKEEDNFNSNWWETNFVSINNDTETLPISKVDFSVLNTSDLIRIFEYVILCRNDISKNRVNQQYFQNVRENKIKQLECYGYTIELNNGQAMSGGNQIIIDRDKTDTQFDAILDSKLLELGNKSWMLLLNKPKVDTTDKCTLCDHYSFVQEFDINRNKICCFCSCAFGHFKNIDDKFRIKYNECKHYNK